MDGAIIAKLKKVPRRILGITELRRNPQKVFGLAKKQGLPILVTEFSKPQGIILSLETFDNVVDALTFSELRDAWDSIEVYRKEKNKGVLKKLSSLEDFIADED